MSWQYVVCYSWMYLYCLAASTLYLAEIPIHFQQGQGNAVRCYHWGSFASRNLRCQNMIISDTGQKEEKYIFTMKSLRLHHKYMHVPTHWEKNNSNFGGPNFMALHYEWYGLWYN